VSLLPTEQSNQVFSNVRAATGQVVQVGEAVAQLNQENSWMLPNQRPLQCTYHRLGNPNSPADRQLNDKQKAWKLCPIACLIKYPSFFSFSETDSHWPCTPTLLLILALPGTKGMTLTKCEFFSAGEHSSIFEIPNDLLSNKAIIWLLIQFNSTSKIKADYPLPILLPSGNLWLRLPSSPTVPGKLGKFQNQTAAEIPSDYWF